MAKNAIFSGFSRYSPQNYGLDFHYHGLTIVLCFEGIQKSIGGFVLSFQVLMKQYYQERYTAMAEMILEKNLQKLHPKRFSLIFLNIQKTDHKTLRSG